MAFPFDHCCRHHHSCEAVNLSLCLWAAEDFYARITNVPKGIQQVCLVARMDASIVVRNPRTSYEKKTDLSAFNDSFEVGNDDFS
jgi:hypothetical protein